MVYLFTGMSTSYGLFYAEMGFICRCLNTIISIHIFSVLLKSFIRIHTFLFDYNNHFFAYSYKGILHGVVANVLDSDIVVSEFKL